MRSAALAVLGFLAACGAREDPVSTVSPQAVAQRPALYASETIQARVIDAGTGEAIAGAIVVARWSQYDRWTRRPISVFRYFETTTDGDGAFRIPAWGPAFLDYAYRLDADDPELWILKRGYVLGYFDETGMIEPRAFSNETVLDMIGRSYGNSERAERAGSIWNGRDLRLRRGTPEAMARSRRAAALLQAGQIVPLRLPLWEEELRLY